MARLSLDSFPVNVMMIYDLWAIERLTADIINAEERMVLIVFVIINIIIIIMKRRGSRRKDFC